MTTVPDIIEYTAGRATAAELDLILNAVNIRRKAIGAARAATVHKGADVTLTGLSPKALNGLTGEVQNISGTRCDVRLSTNSTASLAFSRTKFALSAQTAPEGQYVLRGVPLSCCTIAA